MRNPKGGSLKKENWMATVSISYLIKEKRKKVQIHEIN